MLEMCEDCCRLMSMAVLFRDNYVWRAEYYHSRTPSQVQGAASDMTANSSVMWLGQIGLCSHE